MVYVLILLLHLAFSCFPGSQNISKTLENASKMHMESSNVQGPYYDKVSSNVCIPHQYEVKQGAPMDYHGNNFRSSFGPQKVTSAHVDASATPSPNLKASGMNSSVGHQVSYWVGLKRSFRRYFDMLILIWCSFPCFPGSFLYRMWN